MDPLSSVIALIAGHPYLFLFPATVIEGPIATVIGGFWAGQHIANVWLVIGIAIAGDLAGDYLYYMLGRWGRAGFLDRWGKYVGVTRARVNELEKYFGQYSGRILLLSKFAHGIGTVSLVAAGAVRMPGLKFLLFNLIGTIPKTLILVYIGYFFGAALQTINTYLDYLGWFFALAAAAMVAVYLVFTRSVRKIENKIKLLK